MFIVTGGAGFIGSALIWGLNLRGEDRIIVVDSLNNLKFKNLLGLKFLDIIDKESFLKDLTLFKNTKAVFHMGACSDTTCADWDCLSKNNYYYSKELARFCLSNNIRLFYASSAATYGDGTAGYSDSEDKLESLRPLNLYGYSKHLFDLWAKRNGVLKEAVCLKYFNIFGPNEYHKGNMSSMVLKGYYQIRDTGRLRLFKSYRADFADGEQKRDFLYIKDGVNMTLFFLERPELSGIFNIGSGVASTWNDLAKAIFSAMEIPIEIEYIDMPEMVKRHYQYFTLADISKIRKAGYTLDITPLKIAVSEYVEYLERGGHLTS
jgi:ADP-L-glycero-D-manno-heptose 6-epimerase